ncbi:Translin [Lipomyces kononenkoae]|uniref:Translin n=1 Tax=Lipomyces kononenkoae TaxID=34357 RepID=A0ACC3T7Y9_LIPKO
MSAVSVSIAAIDRDAVAALFSSFAGALDAHYETRDRVIKASRDITAASKKIIFALQRVKYAEVESHGEDTDKQGIELPPKIASDISGLERKIEEAFRAVKDDLQGPGAWRYHRQMSGAIQECIEALLFRGYLMDGWILSHAQVQKLIGHEFLVTDSDYILGLLDTTGELMRFAITNLYDAATSRVLQVSPVSRRICQLLRSLRIKLSGLQVSGTSQSTSAEFMKKMNTLYSSVDKVEKAVYSLVVRGSELPEGWTPGAVLDDTGMI